MAAIIDFRTGTTLAFPGSGDLGHSDQSPSLRLMQGGRSGRVRHLRRVYVFRRLLVLTLVVLLGLVGARIMGGSLPTTASGLNVASPAGAAALDSASPHVVGTGDTLWGLALKIAPDRDPRDVVELIVQLNADSGHELLTDRPLSVGQKLLLPSFG